MMLSELCNTIQPLDEQAMRMAQKRWDQIAKPLHSLGRLEEMIVQLAGIHRTADLQPRKKAVLIFSCLFTPCILQAECSCRYFSGELPKYSRKL